MPKVNFHKKLSDLRGQEVQTYLDTEICVSMGSLRQVENLKEATALKGIIEDIARADGEVELSEDDLKLLQKYVEKSMQQGGLSLASATTINEIIEDQLE